MLNAHRLAHSTSKHFTRQTTSHIRAAPRLGLSDNFHKHYEIEGILGQGTFASVHLARHHETGKNFAVKVMPKVPRSASISPTRGLKMMKSELQCMRTMGRRLNAVGLHGAYEDNTDVYLVIELCRGGALLERLTPSGKPDYGEDDVVRLMRAITRFAAQCHAKNIVYRDIKPENFLFLDNSGDSPLKATDFGLACILYDGETLNERCGTPHYMAPEVVDREVSYDHKCDVWSCGVVAYQLLTGHMPFESSMPHEAVYDQQELFAQIGSSEIDFSSAAWDRISADGRDLVQAMLQRDPAQRIAASEALQSTWLRERTSISAMFDKFSARPKLETTVVQRLQRYATYSRFKRVALLRVVDAMMKDPQRPKIMREIQKLFLKLNRGNRHGVLTAEELRESMQDGYELAGIELSKLGIVEGRRYTFTEFAASLVDWSRAEDHEAWQRWVAEAFSSFDSYGSGVISPTEVVQSSPSRFTSFAATPEEAQEYSELLAVLKDGRAAKETYMGIDEFTEILKARKNDNLEIYDSRIVEFRDSTDAP